MSEKGCIHGICRKNACVCPVPLGQTSSSMRGRRTHRFSTHRMRIKKSSHRSQRPRLCLPHSMSLVERREPQHSQIDLKKERKKGGYIIKTKYSHIFFFLFFFFYRDEPDMSVVRKFNSAIGGGVRFFLSRGPIDFRSEMFQKIFIVNFGKMYLFHFLFNLT